MSASRKIFVIVAMDEGRVIGAQGKIPWHLPEDLKRFSSLTRGHAVLMGRKTYFSLPLKFRPLPERVNIVVTRDPTALASEKGILISDSPDKAVRDFRRGALAPDSEILWIIGGSEIYDATRGFWDEIYVTEVPGKHSGDARFPELPTEFVEVERHSGAGCSFVRYKKRGA